MILFLFNDGQNLLVANKAILGTCGQMTGFKNLTYHLKTNTSLKSRGDFGVQYNGDYYIMNVSLSNWEILIS